MKPLMSVWLSPWMRGSVVADTLRDGYFLIRIKKNPGFP